MNKNIHDFILNATNSTLILESKLIQVLWSGYGELLKVKLKGETLSTAVIKYIVLPLENSMKYNSSFSHQRKVKSYEVEMNWYSYWSNQTKEACRIPKCFGIKREKNIFVIVLEDLDYAGYPLRRKKLTLNEVKVCLKWLANFHANFLGVKADNLWEIGTYWHLATRPEELEIMGDLELKKFASIIDSKLNNCQYQTLVHGDAKLANFCFSEDMTQVSAVDFQYVGAGCGMKDIAYFFDSALSSTECEAWEEMLLNYYFQELKEACCLLQKKLNFEALEKEWRTLYPLCWADFYRFLSGWMPKHKYYNSYNLKLIKKALKALT